MSDQKLTVKNTVFIKVPIFIEKVSDELANLGIEKESEQKPSVMYLNPAHTTYFIPGVGEGEGSPQTQVRVLGRDDYCYIQMSITEFVELLEGK